MTAQKMLRLRRVALALVLPVTLLGAVTACSTSTAPEAAPAASPAASAPATSLAPTDPASAAPAAGLHLITHSGHRLAFHVTPGHPPTLVLDAGGGEDSSYWNALVPQLSRTTGSQIITYDRAGMGASDEVSGPWNPRRAAPGLQAGLQELGVTRDAVLVSHSQAGELATYLARANPGLLSGAVLLDANVPQFFTDTQNQRVIALTTPQIEALTRQPSTKANRQLIATAEDFGPTHRAYHEISWPDSVPVSYAVSATTPFDGSPQDAQRWRDAAAAFVAAGPDRTLITAHGSSHDVPGDKPALVLEEIEKMIAMAN